MRDNTNQLQYSVNLQDDKRKHSEIPTLGKHINQQYCSYSDEEDIEYHNPNPTSNQLQQAARQNWVVENIRNTNSLFDARHIASKQIALQTSRPIPFTTIALTFLAIIISGFKGTAFLIIDLNDEEDETQSGGFILRAFWRQILTTIFFIPFVYNEYIKEKTEEIEEVRLYQKEHLLNKNNLKTILFCSFMYAVWVGTMAFSVFHTSMANVYIFNNIYPLFLVLAKFLPSRCFSKDENSNESQSTNNFEKFGALLAIGVLVLLASEDPRVISAEWVALIGALGASMYYSSLQNLVYEYPQMFAVFLLSGFTTIFFGLYSVIFENSTLDMDTKHGLFGVFSWKWIFINVIISLLTGVVNTKLFSYISQQLKTIYVDIAIMSEAFAALVLAFLFGYQDFPNLTQWAIYFFYVIALVLLAVGKSEAQIEQISMNDDNNLRVNSHMNYLNQNNNKPGQNNIIGGIQGINNRGSYLPPSQFTTPNNKQIAQSMGVTKKNTISQVTDMSMVDFSKLNLQQQRNNSIIETNNSSNSNNINQNNSQSNSYNKQMGGQQYNMNESDNNYHQVQKTPINVIIEQDEDINDSCYFKKDNHTNPNNSYNNHSNNHDNHSDTQINNHINNDTYNNNNNYNNHDNYIQNSYNDNQNNNNRPRTLNDSINNFNNEFIKNLKNKDYKY